jgi:hypothetical protein
MTSHNGHWLLFTTLGLLSACSTISTTAPDGAVTVRSRDEFEKYVESVFRYQNSVGNEMISRSLSVQQSDKPLQSAEERMVASCHYLNAVAVAHAEGRDPGLELKSGLMRTIGECDRAAHDLGELLEGGSQAATADIMRPL